MKLAEYYNVSCNNGSITEIDFDNNGRFVCGDPLTLTLDGYSIRGTKKDGEQVYNVWSGRLPEFIIKKVYEINTVINITKVEYSTRLLVHGAGDYEWIFNDLVSMWWDMESGQYTVTAIGDNEFIEVSNMPPHADIEGAMFEVISVYNKIANSIFFNGNWNAKIFRS